MSEIPAEALSLDPASIVAEARTKTGLENFGDESFLMPMGRLLDALDREAGLHDIGRMTQRARIVDSLSTRLTTQDYLTRHPEILEERIEAPFFVVGLPRTGTTMLHRLLATDPGLSAVLWWECRSPAPWPDSDWRRGADPRIADAHAQVKLILASQPELAAIHPWDAEGPDEEIMLLEHAFLSHVPESGANIPSYRSWLTDQDLRPAYAYLKTLLQFLQWQKRESGRLGERWVLKAPFHLGYLDTLFDVFPDAHIVQTHRDPLETIPSIASMYTSLWRLAADAVDEYEIGRQCRERFAWSLARCLESRTRLPAERFHDILYRDVVRDPLGQVREIQRFVGRSMSDAAERALLAWTEEHSRDKRAAHDYTLERFGYEADALASDFAEYRARFVLPFA